jgi:hypothetical protein
LNGAQPNDRFVLNDQNKPFFQWRVLSQPARLFRGIPKCLNRVIVNT